MTSWIFTSISHQGCFSDTLWSVSKGQFLGVNLEGDTRHSLAANWRKTQASGGVSSPVVLQVGVEEVLQVVVLAEGDEEAVEVLRNGWR